VILGSVLKMTTLRLVGRFCGFLDQGRDFFRTREKDGVVSGKLDRFRLRPATHESLEPVHPVHAVLKCIMPSGRRVPEGNDEATANDQRPA